MLSGSAARQTASPQPDLSSSDGGLSGVESWIEWFCKQEGNDFFCEVDRRYIEDSFNLYGLREIIGVNFKKGMDVLLDKTVLDQSDPSVENSAQDLYGLVHARFIITKRGQDKMRAKMKATDFGVCPRLPCQQQAVLPVGLKDDLNLSGVMVYCPRCNDIFLPANRCSYRNDESGGGEDLDGAYFGTTFPHLFMIQFPDLWPPPPCVVEPYVPRVFGYKVRLPTERPVQAPLDADAVMQDKPPAAAAAELDDDDGGSG
jgi:casein kinase II subunit beta